MAIGLGAALIGSAVLGAGASAIGASSNSRAIRQAGQSQAASDAAALQAQREARDQNTVMQQPFYQTGLAANNRINALLGLNPQVQQQMQQVPQGQIPGQMPGMYAGFRGYNDLSGMGMPYNIGTNTMLGDGGFMPNALAPQPQNQQTELQAAQNAFGDWRNNTGYQFRFNEGIRAIDAGAPVRNSGATWKARTRFGQDIGSAEYANFFGALQDQQRVGVGAANALAGVGTNYANNASQIAQNSGQNAANMAIARANNTNALINGVTSSFNNALGAYGAFGGFRT